MKEDEEKVIYIFAWDSLPRGREILHKQCR